MVQLWSNYGPIMVQQVLKMLFCLTKQLKAFFFLFFFRKLFFTKILIWSRVYSRFDNWHWWSPHQRCYRQYKLRDNILRYSTIHDNSETIYSGISRYMTDQKQYTQAFHDTWQIRDNILTTQVFHDTWLLRDNILRYSTIHDNLETIYSGIPRYMTTQRQYTQVFHDTWQLRDNIIRYSTIHDRSDTIYSGISRYMRDQGWFEEAISHNIFSHPCHILAFCLL